MGEMLNAQPPDMFGCFSSRSHQNQSRASQRDLLHSCSRIKVNQQEMIKDPGLIALSPGGGGESYGSQTWRVQPSRRCGL